MRQRPSITIQPQTSHRERVTVAHVGWTGSNADKIRLEQTFNWLWRKHPSLSKSFTRIQPVKFDLCYQGDPHPLRGSDFLSDQRAFTIVVLHHIFSGWDDKDRKIDLPYFAVSKMHSPKKWRERLRETNASVIFAFGGASEIGSTYLLDIQGYRKITTPFGAVFQNTTI